MEEEIKNLPEGEGTSAPGEETAGRVSELAVDATETAEGVTETAVEATEAASGEEKAEEENPLPTDYGEIAERDLAALKEEFAELSELASIAELPRPMRYAELRDLGLTPVEAYLASCGARPNGAPKKTDGRAHLRSSVPGRATPEEGIGGRDLSAARELFGDLSDSEIRRLYRRVTAEH